MAAKWHHFKRIAQGFIPCSQSSSTCSTALNQSLDVDCVLAAHFGRGEDSTRPGANLRSSIAAPGEPPLEPLSRVRGTAFPLAVICGCGLSYAPRSAATGHRSRTPNAEAQCSVFRTLGATALFSPKVQKLIVFELHSLKPFRKGDF